MCFPYAFSVHLAYCLKFDTLFYVHQTFSRDCAKIILNLIKDFRNWPISLYREDLTNKKAGNNAGKTRKSF